MAEGRRGEEGRNRGRGNMMKGLEIIFNEDEDLLDRLVMTDYDNRLMMMIM